MAEEKILLRRHYRASELPTKFEGLIDSITPVGQRGGGGLDLVEILIKRPLALYQSAENGIGGHHVDPEGNPCHPGLHDSYTIVLHHKHNSPLDLAPLHAALLDRGACCTASYRGDKERWLDIDMKVPFFLMDQIRYALYRDSISMSDLQYILTKPEEKK